MVAKWTRNMTRAFYYDKRTNTQLEHMVFMMLKILWTYDTLQIFETCIDHMLHSFKGFLHKRNELRKWGKRYSIQIFRA